MIEQGRLEDAVIFYPYATRFLLEGSQVELTVVASPALPHDDEPARAVYVDLKSFPHGEQLTMNTDAEELEALGRALVACAKTITLTPEQFAAHLKDEHNDKEQK